MVPTSLRRGGEEGSCCPVLTQLVSAWGFDQDIRIHPLSCRDLEAALETLLSLSGKERVKHLVLGHPSLLLMGFELPGKTGAGHHMINLAASIKLLNRFAESSADL